MNSSEELFKGITFSDLMSDVYHNSKKKDRQINQLIGTLQPLIKNTADATIIVPLIKEYLEVAVKNDDHLVKLTAIVQRHVSTSKSIESDMGLSNEERDELIRLANRDLESSIDEELKLQKKTSELKKQIDSKYKDITKQTENNE
jgi:transcriptional regulator